MRDMDHMDHILEEHSKEHTDQEEEECKARILLHNHDMEDDEGEHQLHNMDHNSFCQSLLCNLVIIDNQT